MKPRGNGKDEIDIWNAIDIEDHAVLVVYVSVRRTSFDAINFLKKILTL
jgi:transposase-like protein